MYARLPFQLRGRLPLAPSNTDDRGFTLVEVLIAMVILTVALVSMAELMAITLRMQQLGRNQTAAARMAQEKIDELMNANFTTNASVAIGGSLTANVANFNDVPRDRRAIPTRPPRRCRDLWDAREWCRFGRHPSARRTENSCPRPSI